MVRVKPSHIFFDDRDDPQPQRGVPAPKHISLADDPSPRRNATPSPPITLPTPVNSKKRGRDAFDSSPPSVAPPTTSSKVASKPPIVVVPKLGTSSGGTPSAPPLKKQKPNASPLPGPVSPITKGAPALVPPALMGKGGGASSAPSIIKIGKSPTPSNIIKIGKGPDPKAPAKDPKAPAKKVTVPASTTGTSNVPKTSSPASIKVKQPTLAKVKTAAPAPALTAKERVKAARATRDKNVKDARDQLEDMEVDRYNVKGPEGWAHLQGMIRQKGRPSWIGAEMNYSFAGKNEKHRFEVNNKEYYGSSKLNAYYKDNLPGHKSINYSRDAPVPTDKKRTKNDQLREGTKKEENFLDTPSTILDREIARNALRVMRGKPELDDSQSKQMLKQGKVTPQTVKTGVHRALRIGALRQTSERARDVASVHQVYPLLYQVKHRNQLPEDLMKVAKLRTIFGTDETAAAPLGGIDAASQPGGAEGARALEARDMDSPWESEAMKEIYTNYASQKVEKTDPGKFRYPTWDHWLAHKLERSNTHYARPETPH